VGLLISDCVGRQVRAAALCLSLPSAKRHALNQVSLLKLDLSPFLARLEHRCCVDQENIRGFLDSGLSHALLNAEIMAVFIGPTYFERLW
jgi:hypothetical protein